MGSSDAKVEPGLPIVITICGHEVRRDTVPDPRVAIVDRFNAEYADTDTRMVIPPPNGEAVDQAGPDAEDGDGAGGTGAPEHAAGDLEGRGQ